MEAGGTKGQNLGGKSAQEMGHAPEQRVEEHGGPDHKKLEQIDLNLDPACWSGVVVM